MAAVAPVRETEPQVYHQPLALGELNCHREVVLEASLPKPEILQAEYPLPLALEELGEALRKLALP